VSRIETPVHWLIGASSLHSARFRPPRDLGADSHRPAHTALV